MASNHNFLLTPQQQELLFAALNANRPPPSPHDLTVSPNAVNTVSTVSTVAPPVKPAAITSSLDDSSFLDYDNFFEGDTSLDFTFNEADQGNFIQDFAEGEDSKTDSAPSNDGNDSPEKRSHPDDDDDDANASKRRESFEKVAKKPGRKPLTSEPVSKRKAQNRAAQRAFRERKEKHLKDLEDKVAELEKASEAANSENDALRAQVDKMTIELNEYKKRMALMSKARSNFTPTGHQVFGNPISSNINDVNFQFEFPKFGQLPGPGDHTASAVNGNAHLAASRGNKSSSPSTDVLGLSTASTSVFNNSPAAKQANKKSPPKDDLSKFSNAFTPPTTNGNITNITTTARSSLESGSTSSPSASSHSNTAPSSSCASSSCGTSPEPYTQSPMGSKPVDTLTTIGEEPATFANTTTTAHQDFSHFSNVDINDMSWLNNPSNFRFDPQLFGDYREPQENVLASGGFDDSFFNDALDVDFTTPFNTALSPNIGGQNSNLIARIDAAKEGEFSSSSLRAPSAQSAAKPSVSGQLLTCNKIWEHLQNCPKVQNGDFDLDGLCSDLQKKAKCSGSGAVVDEADFKNVIKKYIDKDTNIDSACAKKLIDGIAGTKA